MALSKSDRINLRCSPFEKEEWGNAAGGAGKISDWLRNLANQEAARLAALPGSGRSGNGYIEEHVAQHEAGNKRIERDAAIVDGFPARKPDPKEPDKCPRWFHHRSGTYCSHCQTVPK